MSVLNRPEFQTEEAAFDYLESKLWADSTVCPHCGGVERITKGKANPAKRIRAGLWRCGQCKGQFTVKVGTVFEHARMPLHKMLQAVYLMTSSKKGVSAHQLHRMLEITYKSAWVSRPSRARSDALWRAFHVRFGRRHCGGGRDLHRQPQGRAEASGVPPQDEGAFAGGSPVRRGA